MKGQQAFQAATSGAEQSHGHRQIVDADCYTAAQIVAKLQISKATFYRLLKRGRFPFVQELERFGRSVRYRKAPVDHFFAGRGGHVRQSAAAQRGAQFNSLASGR